MVTVPPGASLAHALAARIRRQLAGVACLLVPALACAGPPPPDPAPTPAPAAAVELPALPEGAIRPSDAATATPGAVTLVGYLRMLGPICEPCPEGARCEACADPWEALVDAYGLSVEDALERSIPLVHAEGFSARDISRHHPYVVTGTLHHTPWIRVEVASLVRAE